MKKFLFLSLMVLLAASCQKEPYRDSDNEYLVYTVPAKDVHFADFQTFNIPDSILVIGQSAKPYYSVSPDAKAIVAQFISNMEKLGYSYTSDREAADLGIQLTYVVKTERFVQYYSDPYWWLDYPGYWSPGYWGNWNRFYYPYPVSYTYTTNALLTDMLDLTVEGEDEKPLEIIWSSYIGGPTGNLRTMQTAIDQAFIQSPYLGAAEQQ
ncbi:MAG: DUF4136 domain-containing protein [Bacteroidales bacterium]|nr:DUF4136 domain-containing protein [Bacteroidales bacterium]MBQ6688187.1 DUF4136 domain-containing protein [Bacteroidales bacterium]